MPTRRAILFGPFRVLPAQQLLLKGDTPVRLGSRALEILIALVERPGELVGKGELLARAWPDTVVEESNLKVQIAGLRRALGCGCGNRYLATSSGRGYRFVAQSRSRKRSRSYRRRSLRERNRRTIWARITQLVGRVDVIVHVAAQLPGQRLLTIVGPGGIGKTDIANRLVGSYEHGGWLVDLPSLIDPRLVPTALAVTLELLADDPLPALIAALRDK
jgi:DNA-binding winged helix-turn-helix (wHTH) protein